MTTNIRIEEDVKERLGAMPFVKKNMSYSRIVDRLIKAYRMLPDHCIDKLNQDESRSPENPI